MKRCLLLLVAVAGCDSDEPACDPASDFGCSAELACETVAGGSPSCVTPLVVRGTVRSSGGTPLAGARLIAVADDGAAVAAAATSGADGRYGIRLPSPRDASLRPLSTRLRLRASALGHGSVPDGWRDWPSFDLASASKPANENTLVVSGVAADPELVPFAGGPGRGVLSGNVPLPTGGGPVLVVAETDRSVAGRPRGLAAWTDLDGNYTLFGLASAEHRVRAYARGSSYGERLITVDAGEQTAQLDLRIDDAHPPAAVSGSVEVAAGTGSPQVALVVASTWVQDSAAGEEPAGLRTTVGSGGTFSFASVPAGRYVLVSREADGFVALDDALPVEVAGEPVVVQGRLRLVPALPVVSPGAEHAEAVTPRPPLTWADMTGEDHYQLDVVNAAGLTVMSRVEPAHDGSSPSVIFDVPFVPGQIYRFRACAVDGAGTLLGKTEDRRGIFYLQE